MSALLGYITVLKFDSISRRVMLRIKPRFVKYVRYLRFYFQ